MGRLNSPNLVYVKVVTEFADLFRRHKTMRLIMVRTKNGNYSYGGEWARHNGNIRMAATGRRHQCAVKDEREDKARGIHRGRGGRNTGRGGGTLRDRAVSQRFVSATLLEASEEGRPPERSQGEPLARVIIRLHRSKACVVWLLRRHLEGGSPNHKPLR